ncbi:hypothetical protein [Sporosalibacterium faouarense]|uniref:hypothetical protein n=1 Tax=Sporosalibacterium faouarense TaxID=516123 RepID=UPI00141C5C72|nr:hypothetical protein [Sporosalibacterium faouarense]MTI49743.1 hypothetical protein [Bacillota bacterium]
MEDKRTLADIITQTKEISKNNENSISSINSIEMLLTSDNNGTAKDRNISETISNLKNKLQETVDATNEMISMIDKNRQK